MAIGLDHQVPFALICPACGGALKEGEEESGPSFICHIGHAFSLAEMDVQQMHLVDRTLSAALRVLNERAELCRQLADKLSMAGDRRRAARWTEMQREVELKAEVMRKLIQRGWVDPMGSSS